MIPSRKMRRIEPIAEEFTGSIMAGFFGIVLLQLPVLDLDGYPSSHSVGRLFLLGAVVGIVLLLVRHVRDTDPDDAPAASVDPASMSTASAKTAASFATAFRAPRGNRPWARRRPSPEITATGRDPAQVD